MTQCFTLSSKIYLFTGNKKNRDRKTVQYWHCTILCNEICLQIGPPTMLDQFVSLLNNSTVIIITELFLKVCLFIRAGKPIIFWHHYYIVTTRPIHQSTIYDYFSPVFFFTCTGNKSLQHFPVFKVLQYI